MTGVVQAIKFAMWYTDRFLVFFDFTRIRLIFWLFSSSSPVLFLFLSSLGSLQRKIWSVVNLQRERYLFSKFCARPFQVWVKKCLGNRIGLLEEIFISAMFDNKVFKSSFKIPVLRLKAVCFIFLSLCSVKLFFVLRHLYIRKDDFNSMTSFDPIQGMTSS